MKRLSLVLFLFLSVACSQKQPPEVAKVANSWKPNELLESWAKGSIVRIEPDELRFLTSAETRIKREIKMNDIKQSGAFKRRYSHHELMVKVGMILSRYGVVQEVLLLEPSSSNTFNDAAIQWAKAVGAFPNPPRSLLNPDGKVYLPFYYGIRVRTKYK